MVLRWLPAVFPNPCTYNIDTYNRKLYCTYARALIHIITEYILRLQGELSNVHVDNTKQKIGIILLDGMIK